MRSFNKKADNIRTIIGVMGMITDAEIGEVKLNPLKNVNILKATPVKAAAAILGKSEVLIFSVGISLAEVIKYAASQNNTVEIPTRTTIKPYGCMYSGITSLAIVKVSP